MLIGNDLRTDQLTHNALVLKNEMAWFETVLSLRVAPYTPSKTVTSVVVETPKRRWWQKLLGIGKKTTPSVSASNQTDVSTSLPPVSTPDLSNDDSFYAQFVNKHSLLNEDRLVLMLALTPHIQPQLLDKLFIKNSETGVGNVQFGGVKGTQHGGFLPTVETALFLLSGNNLDKRLQDMQVFHPNSPLIKDNILQVSNTAIGEPFEASRIMLSEDALAEMTKGESWQPRFSVDFPAKILTTPLNWEDLSVTSETKRQLDFINQWLDKRIAFEKHLEDLYALKPGFKALFYGPPGTGKTLTAALIGKKHNLDVYRIDLSMVVSKYIGETEKNLEKVFTRAEGKNWILLFDEADALFGSRTTIKDAHDKYANQEVAYLLQKIEYYPGLVILATNMQHNIDDAFSRRMQAIINFPRPNNLERQQLWEKALKISGLFPFCKKYIPDLARRYDLTGASIMNIVHYTALSTFEKGDRESIELIEKDKELMDLMSQESMNVLFQGIKKEYQKEGRNF
jgi:AAA+ superfamily predicted ATPase